MQWGGLVWDLSPERNVDSVEERRKNFTPRWYEPLWGFCHYLNLWFQAVRRTDTLWHLISSNALFSSCWRFPQEISSQTIILGMILPSFPLHQHGWSGRGRPIFAKNSGCQELALLLEQSRKQFGEVCMCIFIRDVTLGGKFGSTGYGGKAAHFPHGKASLFSESMPSLPPGRTWVTLQIPSCPAASCPFTHHQSDKTPIRRHCGTDCPAILSEIKSNVAKAVFVGISKGPYWCELHSISRVSVSEIFCTPMKIPASMLRFCFWIDCCSATWEMVWTVMFAPTKMSLKEWILQIWDFGLIGSSWEVGLLASQEQRKLPLGTDHRPDIKENPPRCGFSGIFEASDLGHCWRCRILD